MLPQWEGCSDAALTWREKKSRGTKGHEWTRQHVYLEPWDNVEVESMLLVMELFLLVRHTHPPLRMEMEDIHTQKKHHFHMTTFTLMEDYSQGEFRHDTTETWAGDKVELSRSRITCS